MVVRFSSILKYVVFSSFIFVSSFAYNQVHGVFEASDFSDSKEEYDLVWLKPGEDFNGSGQNFEIYCQESCPKSIIYVWRSVYLLFERVPKNYKLFGGENKTDVYQKFNSETIWYPSSWVSWRGSYVDFPAFNQYCIGVDTHEKYSVRLVIRAVNYWKVLQTVIGIALFISSPSLSRNIIFHYASGMSCGVVASVLILLYVLTKFIPKKSASYAFLLLGYSMLLYLLQQFYNNLTEILANYMGILLAYVFFSAFVSFIVCYRFGPVSNLRTIHIIQWSLQVLALCLIFFSTEYREISTSLIMIVLTYYFIPLSWTGRIKAIWYRYFPPKLKLLTETEYIEQGNRETKKALENLRLYCSSPECCAWSTVMKLKDPKRFASFIKGSSHLTDEEILLYDSEVPDVDEFNMTDDDDVTFHYSNHTSF